MNILSKIVSTKFIEVEQQRALISIKKLEERAHFTREVFSMKQMLSRTDRAGIIAEIKRGSPSTGIINENIDVRFLSQAYIEAGAGALSILTDGTYFNGSTRDLEIARKDNQCPILRKDFIVDEYQVIEAKSIGADCILLIAACLSSKKCKQLAQTAKSLGLETLLEVHQEIEIKSHLSDYIDIIGVNNRNLSNFTTDINRSIKLAASIPANMTKISESGISTAPQIKLLREHGFNGFLVGTSFMKNQRPDVACKELIDELNITN